jgi:hypothetical protein
MSGYFQNVVQRSLGIVPVLTPRKASRFEPQTRSPGLGIDEVETQQDESISSYRPISRPSEAVPDPVRPSSRTTEPRPAASIEHRVEERVVEHSREVFTRQSIEHRIERIHEQEAPITRAQVTSTPSVSQPGELTAIHSGVSEERVKPLDEFEADRPEIQSAWRTEHQKATVPNRLGESESQVRSNARQEQNAIRTVEPAARRVGIATAAVTRDVRPAAVETRTLTPQAAPPEVHITIGRVEVRAHVDRPAAAGSTPRGPKLSLDEYLRRRTGA